MLGSREATAPFYSGKPLVVRREMIRLAGGSLAMLGGLAAFGARAAEPTETMTLGPMYPVTRPLDEDADLTVVNGIKNGARGQLIELAGRVLRMDGTPVAGARIELWQANAAGRYAHPADPSAAPLDPGFQGFGVQLTDSEGRYRFRTVKPGAYPTPDGRMRSPHLHFDVKGRGSRLVTQMFFPGDPLHAKDFLLADGRAPASLVAAEGPARSDGAVAYGWDVTLLSG